MTPQCVILVGGLGSRLGSVTQALPKPLVDVAGRPFLDYLLCEIARYPFRDIVLLAGYKGEIVREHYDGRRIGLARVRCVVESRPAGTAGALQEAASLLAQRFLLLNGDSIFDLNLLDLAVRAEAAGTMAHLALGRLRDASRSGVVTLDGDRITGFLERGASGPGLINGGVYALRREILDRIDRIPMSLEADLFPALAAAGALSGTAYDSFFLDIGVPSSLAEAQTAIPAWYRRPAVFFDRDGVLNEDLGYVGRIEEFRWINGACEAIKLVNDHHRLAIIVTNQSGVARGLYSENDVHVLRQAISTQLAVMGAHFDGYYYCPHHPDIGNPPYRTRCPCRKPAPGMILRAAEELPADLRRSILVGDAPSDMAAAEAAGITGHLFTGGRLDDFVAQLLRSNISPT